MTLLSSDHDHDHAYLVSDLVPGERGRGWPDKAA